MTLEEKVGAVTVAELAEAIAVLETACVEDVASLRKKRQEETSAACWRLRRGYAKRLKSLRSMHRVKLDEEEEADAKVNAEELADD